MLLNQRISLVEFVKNVVTGKIDKKWWSVDIAKITIILLAKLTRMLIGMSGIVKCVLIFNAVLIEKIL